MPLLVELRKPCIVIPAKAGIQVPSRGTLVTMGIIAAAAMMPIVTSVIASESAKRGNLFYFDGYNGKRLLRR